MYVDSQTEFSSSQAVTASAISSNVLDIFSTLAGGTSNGAAISPNAKINIGNDVDLSLVVSTAVAATAAGAATLTISLESADDAGLTTNSQVMYSSGPLALAAFQNAGSQLASIKLPSGQYRRYLGVRYTIGTGPLTAGAFDAFLTPAVANNQAYASGFTVQ
jgi:hypothetical protein